MVIGLGRFLGQIGRRLAPAGVRDLSDAQLLEQFLRQGDQAAFAGLLERHGLMVWNVCRRVLTQEQDAEDAFQATFLVLMRKAGSIRKREALGCWLYGVAYRVACQARAAGQRRRTVLREIQAMTTDEAATRAPDVDFRSVLDEELSRLPHKYRAPLVLCYLQGKTNEQAAQELGWPSGSMSRRLARACELLRVRLVRRGLTLFAGTWALLLAERARAAPLPAALVSKTTGAILGTTAATGFSAAVTTLADRVIRSMFVAKLKLLACMTLALIGLVAAGMVPHVLAQSPPDKDPPTRTRTLPGQKPTREPDADPVDRHGDPLPLGAVARLGTLRLRHGGQVYAVAHSPDGTILASGGRNSVIRLWDAASHKEIRQLQGHQNTIMAIAFSADGKRLISASEDRTLRLFEVATGKLLGKFQGHEAAVTAVVLVPDGKTVISAGLDRTIRFWEVPVNQLDNDPWSGKEVRCLNDKLGYLYSLALSPDGKTLAAGNGTGRIRLWDRPTGEQRGELLGHEGEVLSLAFVDNDTLASAGNDFRVWKVSSGTVAWQTRQGHSFNAVTVSRNRKLIAAAGHVGTVVVYDRETRREWKDPATRDESAPQPGEKWGPSGGVPDGIKALSFSPDGRTLVAGGFNSRVHQWDVVTGNELRFPQEHRSDVVALAFSPDSKLLATGSRDRILRVWSVSSAIERWRAAGFGGSEPFVCSVAFSGDGRTLAGAIRHGDLRLWDAVTGQEKARLWAVDNGGPRCCVYSRDGALLASGGMDGSIQLWKTATGETGLRLENKGCEVHKLAFSPDGKRLVAGCHDPNNKDAHGVLRVWNLNTGKLEKEIPAHKYGVIAADFSPDGRYFASLGTNEAQVRLWDGAFEDPRPTLTPPHLPHAYSAVFSPDSKTLAIGMNRVVVLWDPTTKKELRRLDGHLRVIEALAFSAEGRLLASASADSTVVIWDVSGQPIQAKVPLSLVPMELDQLCKDLGDPDEGRAASAQRTLAAGAGTALPYLHSRLQEWLALEPRRVVRWLTDLDSNQFKLRQQATIELQRLGPAVVPELKKALTVMSTAEGRRRIETLLDQLGKEIEAVPPPPPERVLAVLERMGTREARELLVSLARGEPGSTWTKAAQDALNRLEK